MKITRVTAYWGPAYPTGSGFFATSCQKGWQSSLKSMPLLLTWVILIT